MLEERRRHNRDAAYFHSANRGKRSIVVDFATPEASGSCISALAASADVLLENFKVGGLAKYGLDYESLKAVNPRLIYCSITGFGQDGPYAERPGYDFIDPGDGRHDGASPASPTAGREVRRRLRRHLHRPLRGHRRSRRRSPAGDETGKGQHIDMALLDTTRSP